MSPVHLPESFRNSHEYAISLHDEIVELVTVGGQQGIWGSVGVQLRAEHSAADIASLEGESLWDWLEGHGYQDAVDEMALRGAVGAVSSDFCNFVLEALKCSEKGKLTVAYALLRKPLKENLYLLEWMLADPTAFLRAFHNADAEPLSFGTAYRDKTLLPTIKAAASLTQTTAALPAEFLFKLRYDRTASYGFEPLWNKALHLVTTYKFCRTTRQNLNFVFADGDALLSQWQHLYRTTPLLINYARELIELLVERLGGELPRVDERTLVRMAGAAIMSLDIEPLPSSDLTEASPTSELPEISLPCVHCKEFYALSCEGFARLFYEQEFECPRCGRRWNLQEILDPLQTLGEQNPVRRAWEWLRGMFSKWRRIGPPKVNID